MQDRWLREREYIMNEFIENLQEHAESKLIISKKRRIGGEEGKDIECERITEEIKKEIGIKRDIRKKERKCTNINEKGRLEQERENQKKIIQKLVREAKTKHEMELNNEIKERGRGKMEKGKAKEIFFRSWRDVLTRNKNESHEILDKEIIKDISRDREAKGNLEIGIEEHLRMDRRVEKRVGHMDYEDLGKKGLIRLTEKIKKKKSTRARQIGRRDI
ncbi:unnamed protein product [Meganyctiphanes norvegica]|uniref:Uncharacterized protein n=1 Tax=Meganyctiphanes norvegica TaxID=48144 RepID=A0AAV2SNC4_MEGNR